MPISRNGIPYYTDAQYNVARYESSALEYARSAGYQLVKNGNWWTMKEHDSFVFASNGMWFWNSRDMRGGAIEFLTQFEHKTLVEAVLTLAGERNLEHNREIPARPYSARPSESVESKPFELPPKADNYKRLFAYLCGTRGLDKDIVQDLVKQHKLYESCVEYKKDGQPHTSHNAVFVGYDLEGNPRSGFQRGLITNVDRPFKRDVQGSEKEYAFCIEGGQDVDTVAVFEASIDAISHATVDKLDGRDYRSIDRIALGGIAFKSLHSYLVDHPQVKNVVLCLDSDKAGARAAEALKDEMTSAGFTMEKGYHCERQIPTGHKDFNEYLLSYRAALQEQPAQEYGKVSAGQEEDGFFPEAEPEGECER